MAPTALFLCECGPNIGERLRIGDLAAAAAGWEGVKLVARHPLLCSAEGRQYVEEELRKSGCDRAVFGACSPKEHEKTFRGCMAAACANPFMMQMVNLREQCAWTTDDVAEATHKGIDLLRAGARRVLAQEPLEQKKIDAESTVLVVGAGVAGMEAALTLAQKGRQVYVVEKQPCVGGFANRLAEVCPGMECGSCMLEPKLDRLLHSDNIKVLTYTEIDEVLGYYGNFKVKLRTRPRHVDPGNCFGCDECVKACPVTNVRNEYTDGMNTRRAIYFAYPGALPNLPVIDHESCLRFKGQECTACAAACPFQAIDYKQEEVVTEISVGAVVLATGFRPFDVSRVPGLGHGRIPEVYSSIEFEHMLNTSGPTGGEIRRKDGTAPKSIAFVHCAGSLSAEYNDYCSGTCCTNTMKLLHLAHKKLPDAALTDVHGELVYPGKGQVDLAREVAKEGVQFLRTADPNRVTVTASGKGCKLVVPAVNGSGKATTIEADMVVLAAGMEPGTDTVRLASMLGVTTDRFGFYKEGHNRLGAVETNIIGVQIAGCGRGPADIQGSVVQGGAAAGRILSALVPGEKLELEAAVASADEDVCGGCKMCIAVCPYKAITTDPAKGVAVVNAALCQGCGTCAATCPSGAMQARHFTNMALFAEIGGLIR